MALALPLLAVGAAGYNAVQQRNAGNRAESAQKIALAKQDEIQKKQEERQQREAILLSDEIRSKSRARGRRSLLADGEETGVGKDGLRGITG